MDIPKIKNTKDLALYLKILAEESVRQAYSDNLLEAPKDDPLFGGDEEDVGAETAAGGEEDTAAKAADALAAEPKEEPAIEEPAPKPEKEKVEIRPTPLTLELGRVTTDGLIATLNMIRAGRSLKEADVAGELRKYIEKQLSDSERLALATFLSAIRDITAGKPAEEAPDPSDKDIDIDSTDKEEKRDNQEYQQPAPQQQVQVPQQPRGTGIEDVTPPIRVGPRNESKEIKFREYIKTILG